MDVPFVKTEVGCTVDYHYSWQNAKDPFQFFRQKQTVSVELLLIELQFFEIKFSESNDM